LHDIEEKKDMLDNLIIIVKIISTLKNVPYEYLSIQEIFTKYQLINDVDKMTYLKDINLKKIENYIDTIE